MEDSRHIIRYEYEGDAPEADVERILSVNGLTLLDRTPRQLLVQLESVWVALFLLDMVNNMEGWFLTQEATGQLLDAS